MPNVTKAIRAEEEATYSEWLRRAAAELRRQARELDSLVAELERIPSLEENRAAGFPVRRDDSEIPF